MRRLLKQSDPWRREYYRYLAHQAFLELSSAEDFFGARQFTSSEAALFRSAEFFWKALTILTPGQFFRTVHEADANDVMKISSDLLSTDEKSFVLKTLTRFPKTRRELAIYGYYEHGVGAKSPLETFTKADVELDLEEVRGLLDLLKRIHTYQMSEAPIRVGVLSGYVDGPVEENMCSYRPYAGYRSPDGWITDLNAVSISDQRLFDPIPVHISQINTELAPVVINPFGEAIPEKKNDVNVGFDAIREYVRNGGIFINVAGQPFVYGWDVTRNEEEVIIQPVRSLAGLRFVTGREQPYQIELLETFSFRPLADHLRKIFGFETIWDNPPGPTGPREVAVRHRIFDRAPIETVQAKVFRPVKPADNIIPLLDAETPDWGAVYPAAAIRHGRGTLVTFGLNLDGEREYRLAVEIITRIASESFEHILI